MAAGPARGAPGPKIAGTCVFATGVEEARLLMENDPAGRAGVFQVELFFGWAPGGTVRFAPMRFPWSRGGATVP